MGYVGFAHYSFLFVAIGIMRTLQTAISAILFLSELSVPNRANLLATKRSYWPLIRD